MRRLTNFSKVCENASRRRVCATFGFPSGDGVEFRVDGGNVGLFPDVGGIKEDAACVFVFPTDACKSEQGRAQIVGAEGAALPALHIGSVGEPEKERYPIAVRGRIGVTGAVFVVAELLSVVRDIDPIEDLP